MNQGTVPGKDNRGRLGVHNKTGGEIPPVSCDFPFDVLFLNLKKEDYERLSVAAKSAGMSVNGFIRAAINEKIECL